MGLNGLLQGQLYFSLTSFFGYYLKRNHCFPYSDKLKTDRVGHGKLDFSVWKVSCCPSVSISFRAKVFSYFHTILRNTAISLLFPSRTLKAGGLAITQTMAERFKLHKVSHDHSHETNDFMKGVASHLHIPATYGLRDTVVGRHACDNYNNNALITFFKDVMKMHLYRLFQKHYRSYIKLHKQKDTAFSMIT
jgi:hypothetical protein